MKETFPEEVLFEPGLGEGTGIQEDETRAGRSRMEPPRQRVTAQLPGQLQVLPWGLGGLCSSLSASPSVHLPRCRTRSTPNTRVAQAPSPLTIAASQ